MNADEVLRMFNVTARPEWFEDDAQRVLRRIDVRSMCYEFSRDKPAASVARPAAGAERPLRVIGVVCTGWNVECRGSLGVKLQCAVERENAKLVGQVEVASAAMFLPHGSRVCDTLYGKFKNQRQVWYRPVSDDGVNSVVALLPGLKVEDVERGPMFQKDRDVYLLPTDRSCAMGYLVGDLVRRKHDDFQYRIVKMGGADLLEISRATYDRFRRTMLEAAQDNRLVLRDLSQLSVVGCTNVEAWYATVDLDVYYMPDDE